MKRKKDKQCILDLKVPLNINLAALKFLNFKKKRSKILSDILNFSLSPAVYPCLSLSPSPPLPLPRSDFKINIEMKKSDHSSIL